MKTDKNIIVQVAFICMMLLMTTASVMLINKLSLLTGISTRSVSGYLIALSLAVLVLAFLLNRERKKAKKLSEELKSLKGWGFEEKIES